MSFSTTETGAFELTPDLVIREWDLFSSDYGVIEPNEKRTLFKENSVLNIQVKKIRNLIINLMTIIQKQILRDKI